MDSASPWSTSERSVERGRLSRALSYMHSLGEERASRKEEAEGASSAAGSRSSRQASRVVLLAVRQREATSLLQAMMAGRRDWPASTWLRRSWRR